jgi:hypothetical protein
MCNNELVEIDDWFKANKLTANITKASKYMLTYGTRIKSDCNLYIKMGNKNLERVQSIKYLGVMLDDQFKWKDHVNYLRKKLSSSSGIISKLRHFVDKATLKKNYHALVKTHLQYAILCWGSANKTTLQPLRVIQNRVMMHLDRAPRFTRLDNIYLNHRILKLDDLYKFELGKFMHQFYNGKLPISFAGYFQDVASSHHHYTRSATNLNYKVNKCKKRAGQCSVRHFGVKFRCKIVEQITNGNEISQ